MNRIKLMIRRVRANVPALLVVLVALGASRTDSASLVVKRSAAFAGSHGLEVTLGGSCAFPDTHIVLPNASNPGPTVSGNFVGCATITANDVTAVGTTEFRAGAEIVLRDGFDLSLGSNFTAVIGGAGVESPFAYLVSSCPKGPCVVSRYRARFYINLDNLSLGAADRVDHLNGYSNDGEVQFKLVLKRSGSEDRLVLEAYEGGGLIGSTEQGVGTNDEIALAGGWNKIFLSWSAGVSGHLQVTLNGVAFPGLTGLSNPSSRLSSIRWGVVDGDIDSTSGSLQVDEFGSWP